MILTALQYFFITLTVAVAMYGVGYYTHVRKEKEERFLESLDNKCYRKILEYKNLNKINILKLGDKNKK